MFLSVNPIPLLLLNHWVGIILAPAFILQCKILTQILNFTSEKKIHKTKVSRNYGKIKVKISQT